MTRFQLILTTILVFAAVAAAILFSVQKNKSTVAAPQVSLWGTVDAGVIAGFLSDVNLNNRDTVNVAYVQKDRSSLEGELIAALARGQGPDMVLLPQDLILSQLDKFYVIPFASYPERTFKNSFIEEGELFLSPEGVIGLPFLVDPMVMYWNRGIFSNANVALPPVSWTEFYSLAPKIIQMDSSDNITQALIAFGAMNNVTHAKDIISLLSLQAGTSIVGRDGTGNLRSSFSSQVAGLVPAERAVNFFTEFSNPTKPAYSWNRALGSDKNMFLSGRLATYFGFASELPGIRSANPNLNFDVAPVPQIAGKKVTFGSTQAIVLLKSSRNIPAAFVAAQMLTSQAIQAEWVKKSGYPPVHRALLAVPQGNAYASVFYDASLISSAWLDPNPAGTARAFSKLVEGVTSGKTRTSEAVRDAGFEIDRLINAAI